MLASALIAGLTLLLLPCTGDAASLMQRIRESSNLTVFSKLLSDTGLDSQLDGNESCSAGAPCFLVFAPSDEAFAKSADQVAALLEQTGSQLRLANQHIVTNASQKMLLSSWPDLQRPAVVGQDVGLGRARILSANSTVLYWQAKEMSGVWSYHANNAGINVALSNQEAANGVFHVLDDVALPLGRDLSLVALLNSPDDPVVKQMNISRTLKIFKDWMARDTQFQYDALLGGTGAPGVRTAFLPTDAAWAALPQATWHALNANATAFRGVLTAHLSPNVSLFTGWLTVGQTVQFVVGQAESKEALSARLVRRGAGAFVSAGGVVAGLGPGSDLALRDAVVHSVDRVLAAPGRRNLTEAALHLAPDFLELCRRFEACAELLARADAAEGDSPPWTLFAPVDVSGLVGTDGAAVADIDQILALHFVPSELIPRYNMTDQLIVSGANKSGQIRFRSSSDFAKLWVEGRLAGRGYVRSELLAWDESTVSGHLAHAIRTPLGRPLLTLRQTVAQLPRLSVAADLIDNDAFRPALGGGGGDEGNRSFTAFVPDNRAMADLDEMMRRLLLGGAANATPMPLVFMRSEALRNFILPDVSIVADSAAAADSKSSAQYQTAGIGELENVTVSLTVASAHGTTDRVVWLQSETVLARATVSDGEYQCVNGILYVVESVTRAEHRKPQMVVGGGAVAMTTATAGSATLAVAVILSCCLLLLH